MAASPQVISDYKTGDLVVYTGASGDFNGTIVSRTPCSGEEFPRFDVEFDNGGGKRGATIHVNHQLVHMGSLPVPLKSSLCSAIYLGCLSSL